MPFCTCGATYVELVNMYVCFYPSVYIWSLYGDVTHCNQANASEGRVAPPLSLSPQSCQSLSTILLPQSSWSSMACKGINHLHPHNDFCADNARQAYLLPVGEAPLEQAIRICADVLRRIAPRDDRHAPLAVPAEQYLHAVSRLTVGPQNSEDVIGITVHQQLTR